MKRTGTTLEQPRHQCQWGSCRRSRQMTPGIVFFPTCREKRGYRFVPVQEAMRHPAYQELDRSLTPFGESHWSRLRRSRQLEPAAQASL